MLRMLTQTWVLWALFAATLAIYAGFILWIPSLDGVILDGLGPVDEVRAQLASWSEAQKASHFRMTLLLDMIFPFAYGGLFLGLVFRHFGNAARWLALPAFVVMPADLGENTIQLMALSGNESLLGLKALLTPTKFALFALAALIALAAAVTGLVRTLRARTGG